MQPHNPTATPNNSGNVETKSNVLKTLKLSKPIMTHGGFVEDLEFREPNAGCFFDHENPFDWVRKSDGTTVLEFHNKAVFGFIASMTGLDNIVLRSMSANDFTKARDIVFEAVIGLVGSERPTQP